MMRKPFDTGKSVTDKLSEINQESVAQEIPPVPTPLAKPKKSSEFRIALDDATLETLKQKHHLVEDKAKASFYWKSIYHKALKKLAIDTGRPVEAFLAEWAIEGLVKAYPELKDKK